jgi:hypothetical protein
MANRRTTGSVRPAASPPPAASAPPAASPPPAEKAAPRSRTAPAPVKPAHTPGAAAGITVSADARRAMIEQAAYLRAERRGFAPGNEVEDWLAAEAEVDALLEAGHHGQPQ